MLSQNYLDLYIMFDKFSIFFICESDFFQFQFQLKNLFQL